MAIFYFLVALTLRNGYEADLVSLELLLPELCTGLWKLDRSPYSILPITRLCFISFLDNRTTREISQLHLGIIMLLLYNLYIITQVVIILLHIITWQYNIYMSIKMCQWSVTGNRTNTSRRARHLLSCILPRPAYTKDASNKTCFKTHDPVLPVMRTKEKPVIDGKIHVKVIVWRLPAASLRHLLSITSPIRVHGCS